MRVEAQSAGEWSSSIDRHLVAVRVDNTQQPFDASLTQVRLSDQLVLAELEAPPARLVREDKHVGTGEVGDVLFLVGLDKPGTLTQNDHDVELSSGDGVFCQLDRKATLDFPEGVRVLVIKVERRGLEQRSGAAVQEMLIAQASAPSIRVLTLVARELVAMSEVLTDLDKAQMATVVLDTLSAVLKSAAERAVPALNGRAALLHTLQSDVLARLGDPKLSPADLASRHHLSVRYVHALFTESGISCAAYIRQQRLFAAEQLLGSKAHANTPIITIAYRLGFSDPTSFIRAFRRQFGGSPSEYRAARVLSVS